MCARSCRSRVAKLLRHLYFGPLSAMTGGYIIRYRDGLFPNLTLSLIWFSFFLFPLTLYYMLFALQPESAVSPVYWTLYVIVVGTFFTALKVTNFRLHRIFDKEEKQKQKRQAKVEKLKREKEAREKESGTTQLLVEGGPDRRETIFSDDTAPEIGPAPAETRDILLQDPLGSLSEISSIPLKSTTPSMQHPERQSPSIELAVLSSPGHKEKDGDGSDRQVQFGFESMFIQGEGEGEGREDRFMTPVNLPPPSAPQHTPPDPKEGSSEPKSRSPYPDPFTGLEATESPYKMLPPTGEKISRSRSQEYFADSDSQEDASIHAKSFSEMPCASPPDASKKPKENYENVHFAAPDAIEKDLDVHIREKPPGTEGGAEPSNSLLDFEITTTPEIDTAINLSLGLEGDGDLLQHMSQHEMLKFIEFANQDGGHVAFDQHDASPGATCYYRDLVDGVLVAYKFSTLPGQILEERIVVDRPERPDRRTSYRIRESSSSDDSHASSMRWEPGQDTGSSLSPSRRIETQIEISGPPAVRKRLSSSRAEVNKLYVLPRLYLPIRFSRTQLERFFDRDQSLLFVLYFILLSVAVCATGISVLRLGFYHHVFVVWFCVIMASCQFSLLRTIVPDPASSVHGYNKYLAMSKAFYFSCISLSALIVGALRGVQGPEPVFVYGFNLNDPSLLLFFRDALLISLLCLPAGAIWGLLPQVDTFLIYFTEKIDMDLFGGTAVVSLLAGVYSVARSLLTLALFTALSIIPFRYYPPSDPEQAPNGLFSFVFAVIFALSYLLSRSASDPHFLLDLIRNQCRVNSRQQRDDLEIQDPVPPLIRRSIRSRLVHDVIIAVFIFLATFGLSLTPIFTVDNQLVIRHVVRTITILVGVVTHYIIPHLRKKHPWLLMRDPLLRSKEYSLNHEVRKDAKIMWFEYLQVWLEIMERYVLYPIVFLEAMTNSVFPLLQTFGAVGGGFAMSLAGMKVLRHAFCETGVQYSYLLFTYLFFFFDYPQLSNGFLLDYFVLSYILSKLFELKYKLHFLFIYQAPWNMPWGGITHFIIQPLLIPHPGFIFLQAVLAALLSAPLNPFIASSLFLLSYVRPVKFWEKSYRTRHFDNTEGRLLNVLESRRGINAEHMDSIFYDHLAHSLQRVLAGEIQMGRWGLVRTGDFFIIIRDTDSITAFIHIIEVGNGFVTFQLRGCELKGTYCHNMEVRSMNEGFDINDERCCCCKRCCKTKCPPYDSKHLFCFNAYCDSRWSGWEIINTTFVLRGYSKIENDASYIFNTHDAFRIYNTLFVKAMIYYLLKSPLFFSWLTNPAILEGIEPLGEEEYSDPHPYFLPHCNIDYDKRLGAVTLAKFNDQFGDWLRFCLGKRNYTEVEYEKVSVLGWALSLAGRRVLGNATQHDADTPFSSMWNISFLHGVYALFKGDYRINCPKDEWIFADMDLLRRVISPALKIALKLQQDQYLATDDGHDSRYLYQDILSTERDIVIAHEGDPQWIRAVVSDRSSLFTLRYTPYENNKLYQFVRLNTRYLQMRLIKMNKEVIRGLWASQQQEQVYFQQDLTERASIQNLKCVARNLVNSSMDQPIGYPIYVSSLLTSYVDMSATFNSVTGGLIHPVAIGKLLYKKIKGLARKGKSTSGGKEASPDEAKPKPENREDSSSLTRKDSTASFADRTYATNVPEDYIDPFGTDSDSDFDDPFKPHHLLNKFVRITDTSTIHSNMTNLVQWPDSHWKSKANRGSWKHWNAEVGMEGKVIHAWKPFHRDSKQRSYLDKTIFLLLIESRYYVPINESGTEEV